VAYGAAASPASGLAVIASLLLQTGTGRQIAHSKKKLLALKGKNPAECHRLARCWKIRDPGQRTIGGGKKFFAPLSFRIEFCYYDAVIDLDPAIIWRYPTIQMYSAIQFALDRSLPNSEAS
jgi:hypothetical protein